MHACTKRRLHFSEKPLYLTQTNLATDRPPCKTTTQRHACLQQHLSRCELFAAPRPARRFVPRKRSRSVHTSFPKIFCVAISNSRHCLHNLWNGQLHNVLVDPLLHAFSWDTPKDHNFFRNLRHSKICSSIHCTCVEQTSPPRRFFSRKLKCVHNLLDCSLSHPLKRDHCDDLDCFRQNLRHWYVLNLRHRDVLDSSVLHLFMWCRSD